VCGCGISFQAVEADLRAKLAKLLCSPQELSRLRKEALEVAGKNYSWEKVTDQYEHLFLGMVEKP
jgi:glycosyltransferase involved in cell wall biosynthesis